MKELTIGTKASVSMPVTESTLAVTVGSGSLRVFSTPMLTAAMEAAACKVLSDYMENEETTVGTALQIQHTAATPEGMTVTAEAEITAVNGREITFSVRAWDDAGDIGNGTHTRFLVFGDRFQAKADQKKACFHD